MISLSISIILFAITFVAEESPRAVNELTVKPPIESVTLYLEGAQLTHNATFELPAGRQRVVFSGLNSEVNAAGVSVGFGHPLEVLSINHRTTERNRSAEFDVIKALEVEKKDLENSIRSLQIDQGVIDYELEMLELNRVPNAEGDTALRQLLELHRDRIRELKVETAEISDSLTTARARLSDINRKLQKPHLRPEIIEGELVVDLVNPEAKRVDVVISYPISRAGWMPEYEIRAVDTGKPMTSRLNAVIYNNSFQPWNDVEMILSTQSPLEGIELPVISPWFLDFWKPDSRIRSTGSSLDPNQSNRITGFIYDANSGEPLPGATIRVADRSIGTSTDRNGAYSLDLPPGSHQLVVSFIGFKRLTAPATHREMNFWLEADVVELQEVVVSGYSADAARTAPPPPPSVRDETMVSRTFTLRDKQTIPADGELQRINIERTEFESGFSYLTIPKVTEKAMLIADIDDWESVFTLPGTAMLHLEDTFVGQTYINPQSVSDSLRVSFGNDPGITVSRTKVSDQSSRSFLRNRVTQRIAWDISIRNSRSQPIEIQLIDQIPVSMRDQIEVTAVELSGGRIDSDTGMVTWDLTIDPSETLVQKLVYEVRYPRGEQIRLE